MRITLREIAGAIGGEVIGDETVVISGINSLAEACEGQLSHFRDRRYLEALKTTKASAILASERTEAYHGPMLLVPNPALAFARIAALFAAPVARFPGISERAFVHETSRIGQNVSIYPLVYVGRDAVLGDEVTLFPGVFVGDGVHIGEGTVIYPNVTIMQGCLIGKEVIIHAGTVIGSDGFGFVRDGNANVKIPQTGIVQIDDNVEIGANCAVDRAALGKTWIKSGVKTDNLVQIGHNVVIGEDTVVVAQTGISGSVHIGRQVVIGGQVGIRDHLTIGDRAMIGSQSGLTKSVPAGEVVSGTPAMPHRLWLKATRVVERLPELRERLQRLEKKLGELEERLKDARGSQS